MTAKLHPNGGMFTKTVNTGDEQVTLEVQHANDDTTDESKITWHFKGDDVSRSSLTHTISGPVSAENEGVYEAYFEGERENALHAIIRLIVRGKPTLTFCCMYMVSQKSRPLFDALYLEIRK